MALASTASQETEYAGYQALLKLSCSRFHNSSTSQLLSQSGQSLAGCNVGEYLVNQALPLALASVRDEKGHSMLEAAEMLVRLQTAASTLMLLVLPRSNVGNAMMWVRLQWWGVSAQPGPELGPGVDQR